MISNSGIPRPAMFCSLAVNSDDAILDPASKPVKHNALSPAVLSHSSRDSFFNAIDFLLFDILSGYHTRAFQASTPDG
jgi:hypothetical protein